MYRSEAAFELSSRMNVELASGGWQGSELRAWVLGRGRYGWKKPGERGLYFFLTLLE